ncbi:MAG: phytoene desaturase family protein [Anaerolineales bacterium]
MRNRKTAIVIGAGIGGIASAGRLARAGFDVTVLEKNPQPGGRTSQLLREGHRFDLGPTLFLMPEVWEETYAALGEKMSHHLDLRRIDPTYTVHFEDGLRLQLTSNLGQMQTQLERVEKTAFTGFLAYIAEASTHYKISLDAFLGRNFRSLPDYFSLRNLPMLLRLKALVKHYANTGRFFHDERLRAAFTFQNMYLGLSPFDAPATFSLLQYTELAEGVWYPMGGMYQAIESLTGIARKLGVQFIFDTAVREIRVDKSRVSAVITDDGQEFQADVYVGNADLPYVYKQLLPPSRTTKSLDRKLYTCSTIMFYWGVDREYPQIGHHNVFLGGDYRSSFDAIFKEHGLPDRPSFYVHAPARVDPTAAPPGQDTLYVLVPVGHLDERTTQDWDKMVERARQAVLQRLAADMDVRDLGDHIKFEIVYQPQTWKERFNLERGAAFGLSHNFMQVGYLRPQNRHPKFRNLYFAGASTHPGTGLPIVLLSAKLTTERILEDMGAQATPIKSAAVAKVEA